jgi:hypothetical protein
MRTFSKIVNLQYGQIHIHLSVGEHNLNYRVRYRYV